ncbi:MAG: hypothetical protein INR71_12635, partial [Terriglobus roseus]|nr:hypothetical protein [Terriglobus roseus]
MQAQEIADEKERKKDMQRKRRREKTLANESAKRAEVLERINATRDADERERLWKEAQKHDKKARQTHILLEGGTPSKDLGVREGTPLGPNFEGGMMGSFQMDDTTPGKKDGRKGPRASNRPRKTKEQKDAEKASAAAAQAAIDRGEDLPNIPAKELDRLGRLSELKRDRSFSEDSSMISHQGGVEPYTSKAYNQIYEQIWREIAKKDIGKVYRIKQASTDTKASNLRKTAQLAGKEARRWQLRTNKSTKDVQARAKRSMREMVGFWKRNERDERDARKYAERTELENARKAEAEREANRQKRKLNFLISQTELYSHFIGKKVRTEDAEQGDPDVATSDQKIRPGPKDAHTIDLPDSVAKGAMPGKVTNFEDLDFDAEDETALRQAAMANAQNAVKEAQDRAREFDEPGAQLGMDDEGEMNFQNPSSLQNMDVAQPKMLTCQLKEYQLKGLNWLTNL